MKRKPKYPFEEFSQHWKDYPRWRQRRWIRRGTKTKKAFIGDMEGDMWFTLRAFDYFQDRYGDTETAKANAVLFLLIHSYIGQHQAQLDHGAIAVFGEESAMISLALLWSIHHFYTSGPLGTLSHGPTPSQVITLANQYRAEFQTA